MRRVFPIAALVIAGVMLAGCTMLQPTNNNTSANGNAGLNGSSDQGNAGTTVSGNAKSQYWPSNIPTLDAGYDFSYAKLGETYYLTYKVNANKTAKDIATDITAMMTAAGWTLPPENILESDQAVVHSYTTASSSMTLTVGKDDETTTIYSVSIISGPKSN